MNICPVLFVQFTHSIPSHQITRNIFSKNASNFLNSLQDPVEEHEACFDPFLNSLEKDLNVYDNKTFRIDMKNKNTKVKALEFFNIFLKELII